MKKNKLNNIKARLLLISTAILVIGGFSVVLNHQTVFADPTITCTVDKSQVSPGGQVTFTVTPSDTPTQISTNFYYNGNYVSGPIAKIPATYSMLVNSTISEGTITAHSEIVEGSSGFGADAKCPGVTVVPPPTISFTASADQISPGQSVNLYWSTANAQYVSIDNNIGSVTPVYGGYVTVSPNVTTKYTLTATGPTGETTYASVTIGVPSGSCTASSYSVDYNSKVTFTANFSGVPSYASYQFVDNYGNGKVVGTNSSYTTSNLTNSIPDSYYKVTAYYMDYDYHGHSVSASCPGVIVNSPTVTLSASPTSINSGDSATLSWTSTNATAVSIDNGVGSVSPVGGGSVTVSPTTPTTYTITATGPGGTATAQATVYVTQPAPPPVPALTVKISANPTSIYPGDSATLSWSSIGATDASIEGIGNVATSGSQIVSPTKTTTYTITVSNRNEGTVAYASTTVTVNTGTSFTINITDTNPSNPILSSDSSIFTVGDPFTISGGPTNVNDYSIARITSSGGEENLGAPEALSLSGSFSPGDFGLWKVWVSGTKDNPMTSNPIYFAVLPQPKLTPSTQGTSTYCYISTKDPYQYFELHVDKTLLTPGTDATSTVTLTYSLGNWLSGYVCHVTDNQKYDATSSPLTFYVTSTDQYSFDCQKGLSWDLKANSVCTTTEGHISGKPQPFPLPSTNKNKIYIRNFGGAAGGMQEVAPFSQ